MHVDARDEAVAGVLDGAGEQRAADSLAAMFRQHRYAQLGGIRAECDVRNPNNVELIAVHAEDRVGCEVDAFDIGGDRVRRERGAEAQPGVVRAELEEMLDELGARAFAQALRGLREDLVEAAP